MKNTINLAEAARFLQLLDNNGNFTFLTLDDKKEGKVPTHLFHGTLDKHAAELQHLNDSGAGIFVTVNETNGEGRKTTDIVRVRAHFIDSDNEPIEEVVKRFPLKPHMIIETSEGKGHAYYLVSDTELKEFTEIQGKLIKELGTDATVKDLPRVMRLPGFNHMKKEPRIVRLIHAEAGLNPYSKRDLLGALPADVKGEAVEIQPKRIDPRIPLADGYRTETLTTLAGSLIAKGVDDEDVLNWLKIWNDSNIEPLPEAKIWDTILSIRKSDKRNHPERYGKEIDYTDTGNSKRFVSDFGDDVRYCHDRGEWLYWDKHSWIWDTEGEVMRKAMAVASSIYCDAARVEAIHEKDKISRWAKQSLSKSGLSNMVALAQTDLAVTTTSARLDRNDWALNVHNGTIDLKEAEFRPHSRTDMNTKMAQVTYVPSDDCPTWMKFLDKIFNGDKELISWLQKVAGYALTGSLDEQCAFFLIGDGCILSESLCLRAK